MSLSRAFWLTAAPETALVSIFQAIASHGPLIRTGRLTPVAAIVHARV
ncbi:hypothetical protein LP420_22110 [Massilia sp. B-10]|nr:hypothetical protein LP420_22110 [Massilia sp. B-10]UUZ52214.1 hypothetical protein LP419_21585 [Massilia sp. H-1]